MQFKRYSDINKFYNDTYDLLMCHEAQNLIPLGIIIGGKEGKDKSGWRNPENWFMATVYDDSGIQLIAVMTPPNNITMYAKDNKIDEDAIACLVVGTGDVPVPGILARKDLALQFAQMYCSAKGMSYETVMGQRIYALTKVTLDIPNIGAMRLAEESDMYFLPYWLEAYKVCEESHDKQIMCMPKDVEVYRSIITHKKLYILEEQGKPVSIAGIMKETQTACGVAQVYTPPYFRRKGYATSCVAKLSQLILDRGFSKCVLYTDLANPTSNSIYQKIGYSSVCDSIMLRFI